MTEEQYVFGTRSRQGVIAGLGGRDLVAVGVALGVALAALFVLPGIIGIVVAFVVLGGALAATLAPIGTRTAADWLRSLGGLGVRVGTGRASAARVPATAAGGPSLLSPWGALVIEDRRHGQYDVGLIRKRAGRAVVVVELTGAEFALASADEQSQALAGWGDVLTSFARTRGPVKALQILEVATPDSGESAASWLRSAGRPRSQEALDDYTGLLDWVGGGSTRHHTLLAVDLAPRPRAGAEPDALILSELDALLRRLADARIVARPLSRRDILEHVEAAAYPPAALAAAAARAQGRDREPAPGAIGWREDAGALVTDGWHHAVLRVKEWPRNPVSGDWLRPLLTARVGAIRALSVHATVVPSYIALKKTEHQQVTEDAAIAQKAKLGFGAKARDTRAAATLSLREDELASGHASVKFQAQVAVTADSPEHLAGAVAEVEEAAGRARLSLERAWGEQRTAFSSILPLCRELRGPIFEVTTRHARSVYPLQVSPGLPSEGCVVGWDTIGGGAMAWDPWTLYDRGVTTDFCAMVMGVKGRGKSAFVKSWLGRQVSVFGRQAYIVDPKSEYSALAGELGLWRLALEPGGSDRLNPLDPVGASPDDVRSHRTEIASALVSAALGRSVQPVEAAAITEAITAAESVTDTMLLGHLVDLLLDPTADMASRLVTDTPTLAGDVREAALALRGLVVGPLAGMFDGPSTVGLSSTGPGGVIDLGATQRTPAALGPIMVAAMSWLGQVIPSGGTERILVVDEAWHVAQPATIDWLQMVSKLSRKWRVCLLLILHRLSDLRAVGDDSSAASKRAAGLVSDIETRISFATDAGEVPLARQLLGLSDTEAELLPTLARGACLWHVGGARALAQVALTAREHTFTDDAKPLPPPGDDEPPEEEEEGEDWS